MTSIATGGTLTQQLYTQLFNRLDTDGDDALSVSEVGAAGAQPVDSEKVFKNLDTDGDGCVTRAEMTPSSTFGADTLGSLIAAQADGDQANSSADEVAGLFARADLNGDGALDAGEMQAEKDLRKAANLDAGYNAGPIFMSIDKNDDGVFTQDEVSSGQIQALKIPASAIHFFDELPPDEQARMQAARKQMGQPPLKPMTDDEKTAQRAQWAADQAERTSGPAGAFSFLSREIDGLRTDASATYAKTPVSDSLSQRMLQQILGDSWKTAALA